MAKSPRKKTAMSDAHKAALAKGREEGRVVRRYLEALESTKPRRGRKRTTGLDHQASQHHRRSADRCRCIEPAPPVQEKQQLEAELSQTGDTVDLAALEKEFIKVARAYGDRKGITYSAWRTVGVSAPVLQQAKIARTRG